MKAWQAEVCKGILENNPEMEGSIPMFFTLHTDTGKVSVNDFYFPESDLIQYRDGLMAIKVPYRDNPTSIVICEVSNLKKNGLLWSGELTIKMEFPVRRDKTEPFKIIEKVIKPERE